MQSAGNLSIVVEKWKGHRSGMRCTRKGVETVAIYSVWDWLSPPHEVIEKFIDLFAYSVSIYLHILFRMCTKLKWYFNESYSILLLAGRKTDEISGFVAKSSRKLEFSFPIFSSAAGIYWISLQTTCAETFLFLAKVNSN